MYEGKFFQTKEKPNQAKGKPDQIKGKQFQGFSFRNSGLFNGLQRFPRKKSSLALI
jgi:hypothetical protein